MRSLQLYVFVGTVIVFGIITDFRDCTLFEDKNNSAKFLLKCRTRGNSQKRGNRAISSFRATVSAESARRILHGAPRFTNSFPELTFSTRFTARSFSRPRYPLARVPISTSRSCVFRHAALCVVPTSRRGAAPLRRMHRPRTQHLVVSVRSILRRAHIGSRI